MSNSKKQVYALYKGDDLIIMGEAKDCSLYTGLKESTIRWYSNPAAHKRNKSGKRLIAIRVGEEMEAVNRFREEREKRWR